MNEPAAAFRVNLWLAVAAGLVAAVVGAGIWYGMYHGMGNLWMPPLLTGLLIGGAMRLAGGKARDHRAAIIACVLTVLACAAGFVWRDMTTDWIPPSTFAMAIGKLPNDLFSVILIALGAYIAYLFTRPTLAP